MTAANRPLVLLPNRSIGLGPYIQTHGWLYSFCLQGDGDKIDAWLHRQFAEPSGGAIAYKAVTSKLFITFARFGEVRAGSPIDHDHGVVPENDAALWALARRTDGLSLSLYWVPLFVFVDAGSAMATGREVYGFPKQMADFEMPATPPPSAGPFRISTTVIDPFAPNSVARTAPVFEAVPAGPHGGAHGLSGDIAGAVGRLLGDAADRVEREWLQGLLGAGSMFFDLPVKMAFLKQFPDTAHPDRACFQSIVEADARTRKLRGAGWTHEKFELTVHSYASHPFADSLGVAVGPQEVGAAFWADFDFEMELGQDVWTA